MRILWISFTLCYCLILGVSVQASAWATPEQEAQDEKNDSEILKAVFTSMEDYWLRRQTTAHRKKRADSIVCYGELGCFEDSGPFKYIDTLPSPPEEISTKFQLYTGLNGRDTTHVQIPYSNLSQLWDMTRTNFNTSLPTKVIVHGFGSSCNHVWVYEMWNALISVEDCNVFCVDWEAGAIIPNYVRAVANTRLVGKQVAMLIQGLKDRGLSLNKVHIIGFSLGAHVAGFAGAELKNVSRITGLDPAGPLFESQDPRARLDETDAEFVDVIHSNGENLFLGGLGSWQPMGHVDFYPNGGRMQKGCTNFFLGAVSDIIWTPSDLEGRSLCNHRRAYKFFTDSVSPRCKFPAYPCESYEKFIDGQCFPCTKEECGSMGYYADKSSARGSLYLITRDEEPFCANQFQVNLESSPKEPGIVSHGKIQLTLITDQGINETITFTKKDDEELGVGVTLSRMLVLHPAVQLPSAVEITYTAYSGWISSGLNVWYIDKIKMSDSYGKSVSYCQKGLILMSRTPTMLKLFPGDCNLPKEKETETTEGIDPFLQESPKNVTTAPIPINKTATKKKTSAPQKLRHVDGFPAYVTDKDFYEVFCNDSDNSDRCSAMNAESNKVIIDAIIPKITVQPPEKNYTMKIIRRTEITEPILQPKSTGRNLKEEIDEPVLKAIAKVQIVERTTEAIPKKSSVKPRRIDLGNFGENQVEVNHTKGWSPPQEMYPPPLGWQESWDTTREPKTMSKLDLKNNVTPSHPMTLQSKMLQMDKNQRIKSEERSPERFYPSSGTSFSAYPKNEDGSITVQLFPQHLAAILKQAEQYAKMSLFRPLDIFNKPGKRSDRNQSEGEREETHRNLESLATPRQMDTPPKAFLPMINEYIEKALEGMKLFFGFFQTQKPAVEDARGNFSTPNVTQTPGKFIPLTVGTS